MNQKKLILITGVTGGLGRALVQLLIKKGHTIVGCGRSATKIQELKEKFGESHYFDVVDVSDWQKVEEWAKDVLSTAGTPDLIINNAGVMNDVAPLWQIPDEEFARVMNINVNGTVNIIRAFVPALLKRGEGIIANLSSGWGRSTSPDVAPYCASKWAIEGLTKALAQELPVGLAAVAVNPGVIDTPMLRKCWSDSAAGYLSAEEWAQTAVPFYLNLKVNDNGASLTIY